MIGRPGLLILIVLAGGASVRANDSDDLVDRWMAVYHDAARSVEMQFPEKPDTQLTLVETSLLKYSNPVRGVQQHGAIYLWTAEGRPAVIASFWSAVERQQPELRRLNFEWHSLSDSSLVADRESERLWESAERGVEWRALEDVRPPAGSPALRLRQMRQIASSFSAGIEREQESELRLMPQPLYRYAQQTAGATDGALFAFVMGTDPELCLLIESRRDSAGRETWYAACARFTNYGLVVQRGGREWWSCPMAIAGERTGRYFLRLAVERLPADLQ